ncbi:hypothetical protein GF402_04105 [Candidatus Fermentibacteria bacterium]|nr:hypothetical protein [Candidatus Fermentibacteria bacterium]
MKERYVPLTLLLLILGCADQGAEIGKSGEEPPPKPIILIELVDLPASARIPWSLGEQPRIPVAAGKLCISLDEADVPDVTRSFVELMISSGRLMLLYDAGRLPEGSERSHIALQVDSTGNVCGFRPQSLESEIQSSDWNSWRGTQAALVRLFDKYQPDAVAIRARGLEDEDVPELASYWLSVIERTGGSLLLYSPPSLPDYRGWVAIAGEFVRRDTIMGLGVGGVLTTTRVLAGLPVDPGRIERLPAIEVLTGDVSW